MNSVIIFLSLLLLNYIQEPITPPTASQVNAGEEIGGQVGYWHISTYYTPVRSQETYFNGSYEADFAVNCSGDCTMTASGHRLVEADAYKVAACPPIYAFGTQIKFTLPADHAQYPNKSFVVTCRDRGGSIKGRRIDVWVGMGKEGEPHPWIGAVSSRKALIEIL